MNASTVRETRGLRLLELSHRIELKISKIETMVEFLNIQYCHRYFWKSATILLLPFRVQYSDLLFHYVCFTFPRAPFDTLHYTAERGFI